MTTSLLTTSNADFDNCFEQGAGNQLLYIYAQDGQDIGQRYYNVSEGSAYGATGMLASSGTDVGQLLCKAGTRDDGSVVIYTGAQGFFSGWSTLNSGFLKAYGSISRIPYWLVGGTVCRATAIRYQSSSSNRTLINFSPTVPYQQMLINGAQFTKNSDTSARVSGNPLSISSGANITLHFAPAPDGFA